MEPVLTEFWHYFSLTLPVALAVWALVEWRQRRRRAPKIRLEPTLDESPLGESTHDEPTLDEPRHGPGTGCPHPRFKRVHVLRDGVSTPTDEMQCVQCRQRMKA